MRAAAATRAASTPQVDVPYLVVAHPVATHLVVALVAGSLIGLSLGALGAGGSILTVPVLTYLLGQSPAQATTGSLVVVGAAALVGALSAHRAGTVLLGPGLAFGAVAVVGAGLGGVASTRVAEPVLMASFSVVMLVVGLVMLARAGRTQQPHATGTPGTVRPMLTLRPRFRCACCRVAALLATGGVVGLLTGFLGVGGGFVVVPALLLVLAVPMPYTTGTSLIVITVTSATALVVRTSSGGEPQPAWSLVSVLALAAVLGAVLGARLGDRLSSGEDAQRGSRRLQLAFGVLVLAVAGYTAVQALPTVIRS